MRFIQQSLARQLTFGVGGLLTLVFLLMSLWQSSRIQQQTRQQLLDGQQAQLSVAATQLQQQIRLLSLLLERPALQALLPEGEAAVAEHLLQLAYEEPWLRRIHYRTQVSAAVHTPSSGRLAPGEVALVLPLKDQWQRQWGEATAIFAPMPSNSESAVAQGSTLWLVNGEGNTLAPPVSGALASAVQALVQQGRAGDLAGPTLVDTPEVLGWALTVTTAVTEQKVSLLAMMPTTAIKALEWQRIVELWQGNLLLLICCVVILLGASAWQLKPLAALRCQLGQMLAQRRRGDTVAPFPVGRRDELGQLMGLINEIAVTPAPVRDTNARAAFRPPSTATEPPVRPVPPTSLGGRGRAPLVAINSLRANGEPKSRQRV